MGVLGAAGCFGVAATLPLAARTHDEKGNETALKNIVIPAKAGIQCLFFLLLIRDKSKMLDAQPCGCGNPAFAGMTSRYRQVRSASFNRGRPCVYRAAAKISQKRPV